MSKLFKCYTDDFYAVVDEEDYERLFEMDKWYVSRSEVKGPYAFGYKERQGKKVIQMHNFIMNFIPTKELRLDHINGNGLDNRKENLRPALISENRVNARKKRNSKSQYKGVGVHGQGMYPRKWRADITIYGEKMHLGTFFTELDAAKAYDFMANKHYGKFARLNFPEDFPERQD